MVGAAWCRCVSRFPSGAALWECARTPGRMMWLHDTVMLDMPRRLKTVKAGQIYLSGHSAGGMMVHTMLCQSRVVPGLVAAAVDILGGIGSEYSRSAPCRSSKAVPFLKIQGVKDPFIAYNRDILVDGVKFISAVSAAKLRAGRNGCSQPRTRAPGQPGRRPGAVHRLLRRPAGAKASRLCGITTAAHDVDHPWPGWVYQEAWRFFSGAAAKAGSSKARLAVAVAAAAAGGAAAGAFLTMILLDFMDSYS
ncbi:hypothetical protein COO60DRAFT_974661 [Scenedesmus sp. NREL 46B-D3]|nr:hypothetical protein COO60DRAFT_974661 [Scenedesmus sp. NREL 46B-D3]